MIGIIGALEIEVKGLVSKMENIEVLNIKNLKFYKGELLERAVVVVQCGVGKVNSAMTTAIMINQFEIEYIINIGVAGGLAPELNIYDCVISQSFVHHDLDELSKEGRDSFEADAKLAQKAAQSAQAVLTDQNHNTFKGIIASGDQFISSKSEKDRIRSQFNALAVEMEGASIAQVCSAFGIPFVGIRSISDKADSNADGDFYAFLERAAQNSISVILNMLK